MKWPPKTFDDVIISSDVTYVTKTPVAISGGKGNDRYAHNQEADVCGNYLHMQHSRISAGSEKVGLLWIP